MLSLTLYANLLKIRIYAKHPTRRVTFRGEGSEHASDIVSDGDLEDVRD